MSTLKRIYKLGDIKYLWLLLLSMVLFIMALSFHKGHPNIDSNMEMVIYGVGFFAAMIWSILNYIGHLKLNKIYKKYDNINTFVEQMSMDEEEKAELIQYLNDFVKDMEEKGETHEEAVKKAIGHFQVQEFTEARENDIFEKPIHYYLLGYISIFMAIIIIIQCLNIFLSVSFIALSISFILALYSFAFLGLFFIYRLLDILIFKK